MNDKDLDQLLRSAGVPVTPPAGFQRDVWNRIEIAESRNWKTRTRQILERGLGLLALPRFAIATCAAVALAGAWIGQKTATPDVSGEVSYVQSISPFAQSHR